VKRCGARRWDKLVSETIEQSESGGVKNEKTVSELLMAFISENRCDLVISIIFAIELQDATKPRIMTILSPCFLFLI
jgi:DNA replication initiation complex subunit (GINS family)